MIGLSHKYIFILIQSVLYGVFLTLDILDIGIPISNLIKFAVVVLCFIYLILFSKDNPSREHIYLKYALAFTVISDLLILLLDFYFYGLITFIIVHLLYEVRIKDFYLSENLVGRSDSLYKDVILSLLYRLGFASLVVIFLSFVDMSISPLLYVCIIYFISICTNVIKSLKASKDFPERRDIKCFAIGMVLFLLCDINVGLYNLPDFIAISPAYKEIFKAPFLLMWTFYAPSQVLITLSGDKY